MGVIEILEGWALVRQRGADKAPPAEYEQRLVVQGQLGGLEPAELEGFPDLRKALEDAITLWWRQSKQPPESELLLESNGHHSVLQSEEVRGTIKSALDTVLSEYEFKLFGTTIEAGPARVVWAELRTPAKGTRRLIFSQGQHIAVEEWVGTEVWTTLPSRPETVEEIRQQASGLPVHITVVPSATGLGWPNRLILLPPRAERGNH